MISFFLARYVNVLERINLTLCTNDYVDISGCYQFVSFEEVREQSPASPGRKRSTPASSLLCAKKVAKKKISLSSPYKRGTI